jgi:hypothetical protein
MKHVLVAVGVLAFVCVAVPAQTEDAKPGPKLKTWDAWIGDWTWVDIRRDDSVRSGDRVNRRSRSNPPPGVVCAEGGGTTRSQWR